jgi:4-amino-4-deoxychorismate lyase
MPYWLDGTLYPGDHLSLKTNEPGLIYGATVFTTLRVHEADLDHPLTAWEQHCDRIRHALTAFQWAQPDWQNIRQGAEALKAEFPVLRITCFPDGRELITGRPLPQDLRERQRQGITAWVANSADYARPLPGYKTGNYLGCWLALQAAQRQGAKEAILIDNENHWLETSTGNLWGWADDAWWTPPLQAGILPGIARCLVIKSLQQQGFTVQEDLWTPQLIHQFGTLAYSNAVVQVVPIHTVLKDQSKLEFNPSHGALQSLCRAFLNF